MRIHEDDVDKLERDLAREPWLTRSRALALAAIVSAGSLAYVVFASDGSKVIGAQPLVTKASARCGVGAIEMRSPDEVRAACELAARLRLGATAVPVFDGDFGAPSSLDGCRWAHRSRFTTRDGRRGEFACTFEVSSGEATIDSLK